MELASTIHYLGEQLGKVISEQESPALFAIEEQIRADAKAYRAGNPNAAEEAQRMCALRDVIQITINGISAGLRNTR